MKASVGRHFKLVILLLLLFGISTHWETFVFDRFRTNFCCPWVFYYLHSKLIITSSFVFVLLFPWDSHQRMAIFRKMLFPAIIAAKIVDFVFRETKLNCKTNILCWWVASQLRISPGKLKSNFYIISYIILEVRHLCS